MIIQRAGQPTIGFGQPALIAPAVAASPWHVAVVTSVIGAATGWVIEEVASRTIRKKHR